MILKSDPDQEPKFEGCNYLAFVVFNVFEDKLLKIDSFAPQSEMEPAGFS